MSEDNNKLPPLPSKLGEVPSLDRKEFVSRDLSLSPKELPVRHALPLRAHDIHFNPSHRQHKETKQVQGLLAAVPAPMVMPVTHHKPYAFALTAGLQATMQIYYGKLIFCPIIINTILHIHRNGMIDTPFCCIASQEPIYSQQVFEPDKFTGARKYTNGTALDWRGDVYLYWETSTDGRNITHIDIVGPDEPTGVNIPSLGTDPPTPVFVRNWGTATAGKFYIKLGNVDANGNVSQYISSDVFWPVLILQEPEEGITFETPNGIDADYSYYGTGGFAAYYRKGLLVQHDGTAPPWSDPLVAPDAKTVSMA